MDSNLLRNSRYAMVERGGSSNPVCGRSFFLLRSKFRLWAILGSTVHVTVTVPLGCRYDKHSDQPLVWVRSGASGFLGLISAAVCSDLGFLFKFNLSLTRWKVESHIGISQALGPIYVVQSHVCEQSSTLADQFFVSCCTVLVVLDPSTRDRRFCAIRCAW